MLQHAYFLAKIGADTAENEQHFAEILPKIGNHPTGRWRPTHRGTGGSAAPRVPAGAPRGGPAAEGHPCLLYTSPSPRDRAAGRRRYGRSEHTSGARTLRRRSRQRRQRASVGKISAKCCSFSAVSAPIFARKYAFCSIFQNLPDFQAEIFEIWQYFANFATFAKFLLNFQENCCFFKPIFCENFEIAAVQKDANLVELEKCCKISCKISF